MEYLDMFLKISCFSEEFSARITFVFSLTFMNIYDVFGQSSKISKPFCTKFAFLVSAVIFDLVIS